MKKKIFLIIIPVVILTIAIFAYGIKVYNNSFNEFQYDGYVIDNTAELSSTKYYFSKDNKYKVNETTNVVNFDDSDDSDVSVPEDTFVHYTDGSISTFKKTVVLNLEEVSGDAITYYNVYNGSIFTKTGNNYQISYLTSKLSFNSFLLKISENKYMIVGPSITVNYGDKHETVSDGYVEVSYLDGNIVRIENEDISIQNISSDLNIVCSGVTIELGTKKVYVDDELKLNLGEITIDSDDNIEIIPDEENTEIDKTDEELEEEQKMIEEEEEESGSSSYTPNVNISGLKDGIVNTEISTTEEVVEENATIPDAVFNVEDLEVGPISLSARVRITDTANTLNGQLTVKIIEVANNNVVFTKTENEGTTTISLDVSGLKSDTNYSLVVHSAYTKNEIDYEKDFVQKTFVTEPIGVKIEKEYVRTDEFSFNVVKDETSDATEFSYYIKDEDGNTIYTSEKISFGSEESINVKVDSDLVDGDIDPNSKYQVFVDDVIYGTFDIDNITDVNYTFTTLKRKPTYKSGSVSYTSSKQTSKFSIYLANVTDVDNGIQEYRVDLYKTSTGELITSRSSNAAGTVDIEIGGNVDRNTNYYAKVTLIFNDNEKIYELPIGEDDINLSIYGVTGPVVSFNESEITPEKIAGQIVIKDDNETLDLSKPIIVTYRNLSVDGVAISDSHDLSTGVLNKKEITIPFSYNNLRANEDYLFTVSAYVDYGDGQENGSVSVPNVGQFIVHTAEHTPMTATWDNQTQSDSSRAFKVNLQLTKGDQVSTELQANTLSHLTLRFYAKSYDASSGLPCVAENFCWSKEYSDENSAPYVSKLREEFYDNQKEIDQSTFGINANELVYGTYYLDVVEAYDYTDYQNVINVYNNQIEVKPNSVNATIISSENPWFTTPIYNNGSVVKTTDEDYNSDLLNTTIIGYKFAPNIVSSSLDGSTYSITYHIVDSDGTDVKFVKNGENSQYVTFNGNEIIFLFDKLDSIANLDFGRGDSFRFYYEVTFKLSDDEDETTNTSNKTDLLSPPRQAPIISSYISDRSSSVSNGTTLKIKYNVKDVDGVIYSTGSNGKSAFYTTGGSTEFAAVCSKTDGTKTSSNCFTTDRNEFSFEGMSNSTTIDVYTYVKLYKNDDPTKMYILKNFNIKGTNSYNGISYSLSTSQTSSFVKFNFVNLYDNLLSDSALSIRIIATASDNNETVTLYKNVSDIKTNSADGTKYLNLNYAEIASLISTSTNVRNISFTVDIIYDSEIFGFDTAESDGLGYALQNTRTGKYITLSSNKMYKKTNFSFDSKTLSLKGIPGGASNSFNLTYDANGVSYEGYDGYIMLKRLSSANASCTGSLCGTFHFDTVRPLFSLEQENITANIGGVTFVSSVSNDDTTIKTKIYLYKCLDESCELYDNTNPTVVEKSFTEINGTVYIGDLAYNQKYLMMFKYVEDGDATLKEFDYGEDYTEARKYYFTTSDDVGIQDLTVKYNNYVHSNYDRSLKVSFNVSTLVGVSGFKYELYDLENLDAETGEPSLITISTLGLDSTYVASTTNTSFVEYMNITPVVDGDNLEVNHSYELKVIPFACSSGTDCTDVNNRTYLKATTQAFNFYINKPTISISQIANSSTASTGSFSFRVFINDANFAFGGAATSTYNSRRNKWINEEAYYYNVYVTNDSGTQIIPYNDTYDQRPMLWKQTSINIKDSEACIGSSTCIVTVKAYLDLNNDGVIDPTTEEYVVTKEFSTGTVNLGTSDCIPLGNDTYQFRFMDALGISQSAIPYLDYTIVLAQEGSTSDGGESEEEIASTQNNVAITWTHSGSGVSEIYSFNLFFHLTSGRYLMQVTFKDASGAFIASRTFNIVV